MSRITKDVCGMLAPRRPGALVRFVAPWVWLKRHTIPVKAHFRHSVVLTYAFPERLLEGLLPPGLVLDTHKGFGFLAIAMVQTEALFFFQAEDGIRDLTVTGVQTCALPI